MINDSVFPSLNKAEQHQKVRQDREVHSSVKSVSKRKNNRKNTKGRVTQYILRAIENTFPPEFITKCVKHLDPTKPPKGYAHTARVSAKNDTKFKIDGIYYITRNGKRLINRTSEV